MFSGVDEKERTGYAMDSIVCQGSIISGGQVRHSILGPRVRVNSYAQVEDSILFQDVDIGRRAKLRRTIVDKGVSIPSEIEIGYDTELDKARGFSVTEGGIVVIAKGDGVEYIESEQRVA